MSVKIMSKVFAMRNFLNANEKIVLLKIADCAADDGSHAYPSYETIAGECGMKRRGAIGIVKRLTSKGVLIKEHRTKTNGSPASSIYTINIELLDHHIPTKTPHSELVKSRKNPCSELVKSRKEDKVGSACGARGVVHDMHQGSAWGAPDPSYDPSIYKPLSNLKNIEGSSEEGNKDGLQKNKTTVSSPPQESPPSKSHAAILQAAAEDEATRSMSDYKKPSREFTLEEEEIWDRVKKWNVCEGFYRNALKAHTLDEIRMAYRDALDSNPRKPGAVFVLILQGRWDRVKTVAKAQRQQPQQQQPYSPWGGGQLPSQQPVREYNPWAGG
jgi:hypothetical protein